MASYRKRGDLWEYRIRYKTNEGTFKEKSKGGFKTKKEAQLSAAKVEEQINNRIDITSCDTLVSNFLNEWLEVYKRGNVAPRTLRIYEKNIKNYLIPEFGHLKLKDVSKMAYQKFINALSEKLANQTVKSIHVTMHGAFKIATEELNILTKNPTESIKVVDRRVKSTNNELKCYDFDELTKFLEFVLKNKGGFKYYSLFLFLSQTGLRIGECLALQWDDVDFKNKKLRINKTLITLQRDKPIVFGPPKNKSSNRVIALNDQTLALLKEIKKISNENILKHRRYYNDYDFIFTHENNSVMLQPTTLNFLIETCKAGGFRYITLHGFRHTHAVHLLQSGANIKYVSQRLGHAKIDMTANVYLHVTKSMEEGAMNSYDNFMKSRGQIVGK